MTHNPWKIRKGLLISLALIFFSAALLFFIFFIKIPYSSTDTAHWKIYRNTQFGIEFKYPAKKVIQEEKEKSELILYLNPGVIKCGFQKDFDSLKQGIEYDTYSWKGWAWVNGKFFPQFTFTFSGEGGSYSKKAIFVSSNQLNCLLFDIDNSVLSTFKFIP